MAGLRLVGAPIRLLVGGLEVSVSAELPAPIDALIVEEDTFLVLSAPPEIRPVTEHPLRVFTALSEAAPLELGAIRVRGGAPLLIQAVVDDLALDPPGSLDAVRLALLAAWAEVDRRGLRRVGLELLGAMHGGLEPVSVVDLVKAGLPERLESLSIKVRDRDLEVVAERLRVG